MGGNPPGVTSKMWRPDMVRRSNRVCPPPPATQERAPPRSRFGKVAFYRRRAAARNAAVRKPAPNGKEMDAMTDTLLRDAAPGQRAESENKAARSGNWRWIKVWDAPTRLFHWMLVALVATSYVTARNGWIDWHFYAGYAILTLVVFRILWGLLGSETARFSSFVKAPGAALAHLKHLLRREPEPETGHNAAGAYMVLALLALLLFQAISGLFSNDGLFTSGPLAALVSGETSDRLTVLHGISFDLIAIAVALHVAAIFAYALLLRQDLVRPMITGWKRLPATIAAPRLAPLPVAIVLLALAAATVLGLLQLG